MKAVLMVVLCFILSCFDGFSQGYLPMLAEGRSWAVLQINGNDLSTFGTCIYKVGKDSLYGNAHYYPVYRGCDPNFQFMLEDFFREDTVEGKVYRKPFSDPTGDDFLFYDFGMEVGDEWPERDGIVIVADTVKILDKNRKRIYFECNLKQECNKEIHPYFDSLARTWIEGVGNLGHFEHSYYCAYCSNIYNAVTCVVENGRLLYYDAWLDRCSIYDHINLLLGDTKSVRFFQNQESIKFLFSEQKPQCISVYTVMGNKLLNLYPGEMDEIIIKASKLPTGLLVARIVKNNQTIQTIKFINH